MYDVCLFVAVPQGLEIGQAIQDDGEQQQQLSPQQERAAERSLFLFAHFK